MKKPALCAFLSVGLCLLAYTSYLLSWDWEELASYKKALEELIAMPVRGTHTVVIASSAGEFSKLSGLGYWLQAGAREGVIYLQPLSLVANAPRTLAHEMTHLFLERFDLPYWLEEGLVCTVTGEWVGRREKLLERVQELDPRGMDFMTYRSFSYSCWREAGGLLAGQTFQELVELYREGDVSP